LQNNKVLFPLPAKFGKLNKWQMGQLRRFDAALAGLPEPEPQADDECFVGSAYVKKRYQASIMWIHRRIAETRAAQQAEQVAANG
jgi:hypothetical protein